MLLGAIVLVAQWIGGDPAGGVISLAIMVAFAALLVVLERRSDTVAVMRRPGLDERSRSLDLHATAFAGLVVILAVIGMFLYEIARGRDPSPYGQLGALGGGASLVGLLLMQRRG